MLKLFLCCAPCLAASWVAITRSIDNWHHYSDILAGSIIGAISACMAYSYNYGSIFCWKYAGMPCEAVHEKIKVSPQLIVSLLHALLQKPYDALVMQSESMSDDDLQEDHEKMISQNTSQRV